MFQMGKSMVGSRSHNLAKTYVDANMEVRKLSCVFVGLCTIGRKEEQEKKIGGSHGGKEIDQRGKVTKLGWMCKKLVVLS